MMKTKQHCSAMALVTILILLPSCATIGDWFGSGETAKAKEEKETATQHAAAPATTPSVNIPRATIDDQKISEMVSRMEQLEESVKRYRAEVEVLRRAQILGFMPDNVAPHADPVSDTSHKTTSTPHSTQNHDSEPVELGLRPDDASSGLKMPTSEDRLGTSPSDRQSADELLSAATEEFEKGNFGKAINLYWKLEGKSETKSYLYWIGLCWFRLKEYQIARYQFEQFLASTADDSKIPSAKYYSAEIDLALGLKQRAVEGFQNVLKSFPDSDAAALASRSLKAVSSIY